MKTSTEKLPPTTKKQKFVGFKEFIDAETGEVIPMQLNQVEDRDFNFHKLWLQMFINGLDKIANKKMKLAFWIIDHLNKENQLVYTFRRMAEETGLSENTVILTMKELQNSDPPFLKKLQSGVYVINPDILYKGSHQNRMGVIYQFGSLPTPKQAEEIKKRKSEDSKPSSNASEAPNSQETPLEQENVPEEVKTPENEQGERSGFVSDGMPSTSPLRCCCENFFGSDQKTLFSTQHPKKIKEEKKRHKWRSNAGLGLKTTLGFVGNYRINYTV